MQRKSLAQVECSIARTLDQLGDAWSLMVLRDAFLGVRRFQDFERRLTVAPSTLTRRLEALVDQGFLSKQRYEDRPPRDEYALTPKGLDLLPLFLALAVFGNRWLAPDGAPMECVDPKTGRKLEPAVIDRRTGRELGPGDVALRAGPGASPELKHALREPVVLGAQAGLECAS